MSELPTGIPTEREMEILSKMARVISHEVRNPLAIIRNSTYFVKAKLGDAADPKVSKHLGIIESEIQQADRVLSEVLAYTRPGELQTKRLRLSAVVEDLLDGGVAPKEVEVETSFPKDEPAAPLDLERVTAAVKHLIKNAVDAMGGKGKLRLSVKSGKDGAALEVADSGPGVPAAERTKIFEAFYTTKPRGVGLGLPYARLVAERHGGSLELDPKASKGAVFRLKFPAGK